MTLLEQMEADIAGTETDLPLTFSFGGADYIGQRDQSRISNPMEGPGFLPGAEFNLSVRVSVFVTLPVVNDQITIAGVLYFVASIDISPDNLLYTLGLRRTN